MDAIGPYTQSHLPCRNNSARRYLLQWGGMEPGSIAQRVVFLLIYPAWGRRDACCRLHRHSRSSRMCFCGWSLGLAKASITFIAAGTALIQAVGQGEHNGGGKRRGGGATQWPLQGSHGLARAFFALGRYKAPTPERHSGVLPRCFPSAFSGSGLCKKCP